MQLKIVNYKYKLNLEELETNKTLEVIEQTDKGVLSKSEASGWQKAEKRLENYAFHVCRIRLLQVNDNQPPDSQVHLFSYIW